MFRPVRPFSGANGALITSPRTAFDMTRRAVVTAVVCATVGLAVAPALADVFTFETPSENIQCSVGLEHGGSDIHCTIINREGPPAAPRPATCGSDWGHEFQMGNRGPVQMVCAPLNRNKGGHDRADYGVTGRFGGFVCLSETTGLTCRNEDGHGFFLSRRSQQVF